MSASPRATSLQVSRRNVVRGIAWATPAIVFASAAPAAAASLTGGSGVEFLSASAVYVDAFSNSTSGETIHAVSAQVNIQNQQVYPVDTSPVNSMVFTVSMPVGTLTDPAWGLNSDRHEGVDQTGWSLPAGVSGPTISGGYAHFTFHWTGSLAAYQGDQPTVWVQVSGPEVVGENVSGNVSAIHESGDTSSDAGLVAVSPDNT